MPAKASRPRDAAAKPAARKGRARKAEPETAARASGAREPARRQPAPGEPTLAVPPAAAESGLAAAVESLRALVERLAAGWDGVARSIADLPRATDFQPLADHLYEFARTAPLLLDSLRELPGALAPVQAATRALGEIAEGLQGAQSSLQDALFHLPRPSEYEPLAEPLRAFARLSPALVESLSSVPHLASALDAAAQRLEAAAARIEARGATPPEGQDACQAAPSAGLSFGILAMRVERVALSIARARDAVRLALASLPSAGDYAPAAQRLRELASVSPSLLEWMRQDVPRLTAPLAESVDALRAAAESLDEAFVDAELTRRDLRPVDA